MDTIQTRGRSREEWKTVLDRIDAALAQSLGKVAELEPPAPVAEASTGADSMLALDGRLGEMQAALERAERCAAEADASLQVEAENVKEWVGRIKRVV